MDQDKTARPASLHRVCSWRRRLGVLGLSSALSFSLMPSAAFAEPSEASTQENTSVSQPAAEESDADSASAVIAVPEAETDDDNLDSLDPDIVGGNSENAEGLAVEDAEALSEEATPDDLSTLNANSIPLDAAGAESDEVLGEGSVNSTITWKVTSDNTVTFSGAGALPYTYANVDWIDYVDTTKPINLTFEEGITGVTMAYVPLMGQGYNLHYGTVTLPDSFDNLGIGFLGFPVEKIVAPDDVFDGTFLYSDSSKKAIVAVENLEGKSELVIPEGVTTLQMMSLSVLDLRSLHLTIPSSLTSAVQAYNNNSMGATTGIGSISLADGNTSFYIDEDYTSANYGSLMNNNNTVALKAYVDLITDSSGVVYSSDHLVLYQAPESLSGNYSINENCRTVVDGAFSGCTALTGVTMPSSITAIPANAFQGCSSLSSISLPSSVVDIGEYAFQGCTSLASIEIPNSITTLGYYAFQGCTALESVSLPDSVTQIGDYVFEECTSLKTVRLSANLAEMGNYAFRNCTALTNVVMPEGLTDIGAFAFYGCANLKLVAIPDSVIYIDVAAFANSGLESFVAGSGLWSEVGSMDEFSGDSDGLWGSAAIFTDTPATVFKPDVTGTKQYSSVASVDISQYGQSYIPTYMFMGLNKLTSVAIPSTVRILDQGAFFECNSLKDVYVYGQTLSVAGASTAGDSTLGWTSAAQPAFAHWTTDGEGGFVVASLTGLNLYGLAYSSNDLIEYAQNNDCNFIPFVVLDNYDTTALFGHQITGYSNLTIDDMVYTGKALTPQVRATFTDVDLTDMERVLTDGDGVSIVYKDAGGNTISEIVAPGTYTAEITGDGQSVFGTKTLTFRVIDPNQETVVPGDGQQTGDDQQTGDGQQGGITQQAGYNAAAPAATTQAAAAQMPQTGDDSGNVGAFAALAGAAGAVAAGVAALRTRRKDDAAR